MILFLCTYLVPLIINLILIKYFILKGNCKEETKLLLVFAWLPFFNIMTILLGLLFVVFNATDSIYDSLIDKYEDK